MVNWNNAGVEPSTSKQQQGYSAGEKLPAGHLNYFLHNLCKTANVSDKVLPKIPSEIVFGVISGDGNYPRQIDLGFRPYCVIMTYSYGRFCYYNTSSNDGFAKSGGIALDGYPLTLITYSGGTTIKKECITINDNGFEIESPYNALGESFDYIAFAPYAEMEE